MVQVKTLSAENVGIKSLGINKKLNELESFNITNSNLHIDEKTLEYWRGLGIPMYLFAVIYSQSASQGGNIDYYYKRFTSVLTTASTQEKERFYKVNDDTSFLAFAVQMPKRYGFARDLFIDLMRCSYYKGSISYISPRTLGLELFPEEDAVFGELFEDYREIITKTIEQTRKYLDQITSGQAIPSEAPPNNE